MNTNHNNSLNNQDKRDLVLVVDDEANSRLLLKTYLSSAGYDVKTARTGEEALKVIKMETPSTIILDIMLPKLSGYDVCKKLKSSKTTDFIPIILVTALRGVQERVQGTEAGADDFVSKPFNRIELLTRVKSLLRIKRLHETLEHKVKELQKTQSKLKQMAVTDGLTGLNNYRAFMHQLHMEISRSKRFTLPVSLVMMDIDHFKVYNDVYGHLNGDKLLKKFSNLIKKNVREVDFFARYGGEEFALILPSTDKKSAVKVAEKLRSIVENKAFSLQSKLPTGKITISLGVATAPKDAHEEKALIRLADRALYQAKNNGRNRTAVIRNTKSSLL